MPKVVDEDERKNEIAIAAASVFAENGFRETSVQAIAEQAGMSKGNLYHFFDSKEDILDRIFVRFESQLHEAIDRGIARNTDPIEQLKGVSLEIFDLLQKIEPTLKVIFDFWSYSLHNEEQDIIDFENFYRRLEEKLDRILEEGREQGVFRSDFKNHMSSILTGYLEGQLVQWQINPSSPPLENLDEHGLSVIITGLVESDD